MEPRQQKIAQKNKVVQLVTKTTNLSILTTIKNNKSDNAGQNPANLKKFKLKNAKKTFIHQRKNISNRATIFLRKAMILKQNQAISTKTPTKKYMCMFFLQITKPIRKGTIFTKTKSFEHPVKQVQKKRSQISRHKTFKAR